MDSMNFLVSAFGVGVGVGVGLGLASKQGKLFSSCSPPSGVTGEKIEQDLLKQIIDGKNSNVTFDEFPYYLSERTRLLLTSAAFVHLKQMDVSKYTRNLATASRTILVSAPVELYPQMLAKALADYFEAKLLLLDVFDFSLKISSKYGNAGRQSCLKRTISEMTLEHMSSLLGSFSLFPPQEENKSGTLRRQSSEVNLNSSGSETQNNPPKLRRIASSDISSIAMQSSPNAAPLK